MSTTHTTIIVIDPETGDTITLPSRWAICDTCEGDGSRALHGIAITADEWAEWDDDEREGYLSGRYDTVCDECGGSGKVRVIDEAATDPELLEAFHQQQAELAESYAISRMERMYGC